MIEFADIDFRGIQRAAREDALAAVADETRLPLGASIGWTECRFGRTDDLSLVHRASHTANVDDQQLTLCGEIIPPVIRRLSLTPNWIRALGRCRYCDAEYAKVGVPE